MYKNVHSLFRLPSWNLPLPHLTYIEQTRRLKTTSFYLQHFTYKGLAQQHRIPELMGIRQALRKTRSAGSANDVPKGHLAVYVGKSHRRFLVPTKLLNLPAFQQLLRQAEEEFEFYYPTGGLTIPCGEAEFIDLISSLS